MHSYLTTLAASAIFPESQLRSAGMLCGLVHLGDRRGVAIQDSKMQVPINVHRLTKSKLQCPATNQCSHSRWPMHHWMF